jgi:hypothetical protein
MLNREEGNTNLIAFGLTQPGFEFIIYHTWGEHANHYNILTFSNTYLYT